MRKLKNVGNTGNLSFSEIKQSARCLANMCVLERHTRACTNRQTQTHKHTHTHSHSQVHRTSRNALPLGSEILPRGNLGIPWDRNWISIDPGRAKGCSRNLDYCTIQGPRCQEDMETCLPSYLQSQKVLMDSCSERPFHWLRVFSEDVHQHNRTWISELWMRMPISLSKLDAYEEQGFKLHLVNHFFPLYVQSDLFRLLFWSNQ